MGTANLFGALLWEPKEAIGAGLAMRKGHDKLFQHHGMNPTHLLDWQKGCTPILALHGKDGTQGHFMKMGEYFLEHRIGPFFTVNLSSGELTQKDIEIVEQKLAEIKKLCGCEKVHLLGYSRGAELAHYIAQEPGSFTMNNGYCRQLKKSSHWRTDIECIIRIGSMTNQKEWETLSKEMQAHVWEVRGLDDIHMPERSLAGKQAVEIAGIGHLGLMTSTKVFSELKRIFNNHQSIDQVQHFNKAV